MLQQKLISILADGQFHSGEDLGKVLGVSRTAIWKSLKPLADWGLQLESVKGKGYRLAKPLDLLSTDAILRQVQAEARSLLGSVTVFAATDSTNLQAIQALQRGEAVSGSLYLAECQTAGRGRRGRVWQSPYAANIYMTLVWRYFTGAASLEGLSLAVGLALLEALQKLGLNDARLKWPNDVLVQGKKLAGILIELQGDPSAECEVVIGVGLNVAMQTDEVLIDQPWTDLEQHLGMVSRNQVVAEMINALLPMLDSYAEQGFVAFAERWRALDAFKDAPVWLQVGEKRIAGIARGVDARGALQLETSQGVQVFSGGEVSMRAYVDS